MGQWGSLEDKGAQGSWLNFKDSLFKAKGNDQTDVQKVEQAWQEASRVKQEIPPAWPQMQRGSARGCKQGWSTQQEQHNGARACKHEIREVKAQLQLNLAMDVTGNKKAFCKAYQQQKED